MSYRTAVFALVHIESEKRHMKALGSAVAVLTLVGLAPTRAQAVAPACQSVNGKFSEYVIAPSGSPNDPLGRTVLYAQGTINAIGTAIPTSVGPGPTPGTLGATTRHVFVVTEEDQLTATGVAVFTPIPGSRDVTDLLILTITGGTGKFASATGTMIATGTAYDFFPLPPGPSSANGTVYDFNLSGDLCGVTK